MAAVTTETPPIVNDRKIAAVHSNILGVYS